MAFYPWQQQQWQRVAAACVQHKLPHALLLTGITGLGKQHFAQSLAQLILCKSPQHELPCNRCASCLLFNSHNHPDYYFLQPEAESNHLKIDAVRSLMTDLQQTAQQGGYKVAILSADQLNTAAANALLKTLEEPTRDTIIILLSAEPECLLATVRSRCQTIDFAPSWSAVTQQWLQAQGAQEVTQWLDLAEGAPLRALQYAQDENLKTQYHDFMAALNLFWQQGDLLSTASKWLKLDVVQCVMWLYQAYLNLLRVKVRQQQNSELPQLLTIINIIQARLKLLRQHATLNMQLQLESLLVEIQNV
jgi:DNA polymerase-3 subunit delta'